MNTKKCRQCGTSFDPQRATQLYCSPSCSHRFRDHKWQHQNHIESTRTLLTQLADAHTANRLGTEALTAKFQGQLSEAYNAARDQLRLQATGYEDELERLQSRLRELAAVSIDTALEIPELKAQVNELQLENARLLHDQRAEVQEFMQIAGRLYELSSRLGLPLDKTTREIFLRRGWRTDTFALKS